MPKGKSCFGHWNFRVVRNNCVNCGKKGMYVGARNWIKCMYCKLLVTQRDKNYRELIDKTKT